MSADEALSDMASWFEYDYCLRGRNIRLLKFKPRLEGANSQLMNLELNLASLPSKDAVLDDNSASGDTPVQYIASSYVWGIEPPEETILINGKPFAIRINLQRALVHLEAEIDLSLSIWTDAICINQQAEKDDKEKNTQVAQMRDVYENAVQTIIWLGESDASTGRVMTGLDRIGIKAIAAGLNDLKENDFKCWPDVGPNERKIKIKNDLVALIPGTTKGFPLKALIDMSYRPWFKRVWVQQELAVSSDFKFMCGKCTTPGENFVAGFVFCSIWIGEEVRTLIQGGPLFQLPSRIWALWWRNGWSFVWVLFGALLGKPATPNSRAAATLGARRKWQNLPKPTLKAQLCRAFILPSADGLEATEHRDRIYALLGIAGDAEELNIGVHYKRKEHEPKKYVKSDEEVYTEVARTLIQHGHLDVLTLCRPVTARLDDGQDTALPSWVPDWRKPILPPWGEYIEDKIFRASGSEQAEPPSPQLTGMTNNVLTIKARLLGTVSKTGSVWNSESKKKFDHDEARTLFYEVMEFLKKSALFDAPNARDIAFWRIPIGDTEINALGMTQRATKKSHTECMVMVETLFKRKNAHKLLTAVSYMNSMKDIHNARPFISDSGYVGLCPGVSLQGDKIFVPVGSHVPLIFRAVNGKDKVVGEAYVYGMMDGEILERDPQELHLI